MNKKEYLESLGEQVYRNEILCCPECGSKPWDSCPQPLCSFGDNRSLLFCPHCDAEIRLTMIRPPLDWS